MAASLGYMTTGLVRGFSSPGIPSMQQKSPHLVPNESAFSWLSKYNILPSPKSDWTEGEEEKTSLFSWSYVRGFTSLQFDL
jgi:hypothetical protein